MSKNSILEGRGREFEPFNSFIYSLNSNLFEEKAFFLFLLESGKREQKLVFWFKLAERGQFYSM